MQFEKVIYISHAYGGKDENRIDIEKKIKQLIKKYPTYLFISPVHTFGFLYDATNYDDGLNMCLALLIQCEECWILGNENSTGVKAEIEFCKENGIVYKILECAFPCKHVCFRENLIGCDTDCLNYCEFEAGDPEYIGCQLKINKRKGEKFFD